MGKRSRNTPKPASETEASNAKLVARLSRADLEHLVVHSLDSGALPRSTVLSCLPESLQSATVQATVVSGGNSRTGTGLFDCIDDDILVPQILMRLSSVERFKCVISVCKAWRTLRGRTELWREIEIGPNFMPIVTAKEAKRQLPCFVSWLRYHGALSGVTTLALDSGGRKSETNTISPDGIKDALSEMPALTSLSLSGKKVSAALLANLADTTKIPLAANLTSLSVEAPNAACQGLLSLLKSTGRLKHLTLAHGLLGDGSTLAALAGALRSARGGGVPLVTELVTTGMAFGPQRLGWSTLGHVGDLFPELEVCRMQEVCDHEYRGFGRPAQTIADCLRAGEEFKLSHLPRLTALRIGQMAGFTSGHLSAEELEAVFSAVSTVCPVLQVLDIRHGQIWGGSKNNPVDMEPLPAATARCFQRLPTTLTSLTLAGLLLDADAFSTAALPELSKLELHQCGPNAAALAAALVDVCPRLSQGGVTLYPRA
jgi:hypothetical protein